MKQKQFGIIMLQLLMVFVQVVLFSFQIQMFALKNNQKQLTQIGFGLLGVGIWIILIKKQRQDHI